MLKRNLLLLIGLVLYAASYALPAISSTSATGAVRGYLCAWVALTVPWGHDGMNVMRDNPAAYVTILLSGLINPVFLITTMVLLTERWQKLAAILRLLLIVMVPFSWYLFYKMKFVPREGHYLWIFGMLLVLFSNELTGARKVSTAP
jgi:ABC-type microcin C transport system permease subunit YejE